MIYVTMTDNFMTGWGEAENKINKLVISCNTIEEAEIVKYNAECRSDMKDISIAKKKPKYDENNYFVSWHGREQGDYESWFIDGHFAK